MPRQKIEFYCNECDKYFDVNLNTALNGNHRVHCPSCGHIHYRFVKGGVITDTRFSEYKEDEIIVDDLMPMKSSCRKKSKETVEDAQVTSQGFLKCLWDRCFSGNV